MAKFVPDIKTQRWIIIAPARNDRPTDLGHSVVAGNVCAFCPGNEELTPSELYRLGEGEKDQKGWKVRVIPNKFPITDIHEVIIHHVEHSKNLPDFETSELFNLLVVYRSRFKFHTENGQVLIFCNHGEHAGASLTHPHSQLVVIPRQINLDALVREPVMNIVDEYKYFVTYCPDFSQWPYEVWIAPKKEDTFFGDTTDEEIKELASVMRITMKKLSIKFNQGNIKKMYPNMPFAYNYYIHHGRGWFIRIIPRLVHRAGFELGTGLSVNIIDPTIAASELREITVN